MFELEFYESEDGRHPVEEFLDSLEYKMNAKLIGLMELLEEKGTELREPYSAALKDGIFELRCKQGSNITRVMYFFFCGKMYHSYQRFCEEDAENSGVRAKACTSQTSGLA